MIAMGDAILRIYHIAFGSPQPIEWWLLGADLAIVALIVWLDVPEKFHKRRCTKIVKKLSDFMFEGQTLAHDVPNPNVLGKPSIHRDFMEWETATKNWYVDVAQYLNEKSSRAASSFTLITASSTSLTNTVNPSEGWAFQLTGSCREAYQKHLAHLEKLQQIIEKAEAYF